MKFYKIIALVQFLIVLSVDSYSQSPESMSYQGIVRDVNSRIIVNTNIGMRVSILQGTASGSAVYVEKQLPASNINGLVSIEIGSGNVVFGNFSTIDWASGPYFLKVEIDPQGGSTYTIVSTSQLLSVPYALHAKIADSVIGLAPEIDPFFKSSIASGIDSTDIARWNNDSVVTYFGGPGITIDSNNVISSNLVTDTFSIGLDSSLGGYVFYLTPNKKHGLVVATQDQCSLCDFFSSMESLNDPSNHNALGKNFTDWRFPVKWELQIMYNERTSIGGFSMTHNYWTFYPVPGSSKGWDYMWVLLFSNGAWNNATDVHNTGGVSLRAVRSF